MGPKHIKEQEKAMSETLDIGYIESGRHVNGPQLLPLLD